MKWTYVFINHNDGWDVPDINKDGNSKKFEDALTALQYAQKLCADYEHRTGRRKIPVLNSALYTSEPKAQITLGAKARSRLDFHTSDFKGRVYNIIVLSPKDGNSPFTGRISSLGFGMIVAPNGETQTVRTTVPFEGSSIRANSAWTNDSVVHLKKTYGYPENPFLDKTQEDITSFLLTNDKGLHHAKPLPTDTFVSPSNDSTPDFSKISDSYSAMDWGLAEKLAESFRAPPSVFRQMAFGEWTPVPYPSRVGGGTITGRYNGLEDLIRPERVQPPQNLAARFRDWYAWYVSDSQQRGWEHRQPSPEPEWRIESINRDFEGVLRITLFDGRYAVSDDNGRTFTAYEAEPPRGYRNRDLYGDYIAAPPMNPSTFERFQQAVRDISFQTLGRQARLEILDDGTPATREDNDDDGIGT